MKRIGLVTLALTSLTACGLGPVREGVVVSKSFVEAHTETRTHEVYKFDCGKHRKMGEFTPRYGCGMGYFDEDYEAQIRECRLVEVEADGDRTEWCVREAEWESVQVGDTYKANQIDYAPGTEESD